MASLSLLVFKKRYFLGANASHSFSFRRLSRSSSSLSDRPVSLLLKREVVFVSVIAGVDGCRDSERECEDGSSRDELDSDVDESRVMASEALGLEMRRARRKRSLSAMLLLSNPDWCLGENEEEGGNIYRIWISVPRSRRASVCPLSWL